MLKPVVDLWSLWVLVVYLTVLKANVMLFSAGVVCCLCGAEPADRSIAECRRWRGPDRAQGSAAAAQWCLLPAGQPIRVQTERPAVCPWVPHDGTRCKIRDHIWSWHLHPQNSIFKLFKHLLTVDLSKYFGFLDASVISRYSVILSVVVCKVNMKSKFYFSSV